MKALLRQFALLTLFVLFGARSVSAQGTTITILHVNDTHSHLDATGPKDSNLDGTLGGMAKAATIIKSIRKNEPHVLLLHGGDLFQGDLFFNKFLGVPEFQLMRVLAFDAMAVGNHEFDLGPGVLKESLSKAFEDGGFPLLSANLDMSDFPALKKWVRPSTIKVIGGVRVGIFGMTIPDEPTSQPGPVIVRSEIIQIAREMVRELQGSGAEVIICLSHLGISRDSLLATHVPGIDFIVGGHDHLVLDPPVSVVNSAGRRVLILQAGEHYQQIGKLRFTVKDKSVEVVDYELVPVGRSVSPDPSVAAVVSRLKSEIVKQYGDVYRRVVGKAAKNLQQRFDTKSPQRDTPLGNLITDAFRKKTGTGVALTANGLISEMIWKGPIVAADVFRAVSYGYDDSTRLGYKLATFEILGADLVKGLEIGLSQLPHNDSHLIQVSGMRYEYNSKHPVGERVILESVWINGKPMSPSGKYTVTANTGIVWLLSALGVEVENIQVLPDFEYTAVRDYITKLREVRYTAEGRIREVGRGTSD